MCRELTLIEKMGGEFEEKDGVLYEHIFSLEDGKYYLKKSYVKNEG